MSKETFYFSHDYNARADEKIKRLIRKLGMEGYGIFWSLVEDLYNNDNVLRLDYDDFEYDLRTDAKIIKSVINDFGLFTIEKNCFGSVSVQRRLEKRTEKSEKARQSILKRWDKRRVKNTNVPVNDTNVPKIDTIKESKGKDSIEKDRIGEKKHVFVAPNLDDVKAYFKEKGYTEESAIKAFDHYDTGNWHDTKGNPVLNWKQKVVTNWFREENKICAKRKLVMP